MAAAYLEDSAGVSLLHGGSCIYDHRIKGQNPSLSITLIALAVVYYKNNWKHLLFNYINPWKAAVLGYNKTYRWSHSLRGKSKFQTSVSCLFSAHLLWSLKAPSGRLWIVGVGCRSGRGSGGTCAASTWENIQLARTKTMSKTLQKKSRFKG